MTHALLFIHLLVIAAHFSGVHAFVARIDVRPNDVQHPVSFPEAKTTKVEDGGEEAVARFHSDMRRVIESRAASAKEEMKDLDPNNRRKRPPILASDIDGTEQVVRMLQHMVVIGIATEESYQIALRALFSRGRLRWRLIDHGVICAADEVGNLFDQLWEVQDGQVSVETCNLVLESFAMCATPRGRNYANRAQKLLDDMEAAGIPILGESVTHVVHAWSWQQENLCPGDCATMADKSFSRLLEMSPSNQTKMECLEWIQEAWSKSTNEGSAERSEQCLEDMILLKNSDPENLVLKGSYFTNAILAWGKSPLGEAAERAHDLLVRAMDMLEAGEFPEGEEIRTIGFNSVLKGWSHKRRIDRAQEVLRMLSEARKKTKDVAPDVISYNTLLYTYLRTGDREVGLECVLRLVKHMEDRAEDQPAIEPNSFTYGILIKSAIQTRRPDAPQLAVEALRKLHKRWERGDWSTDPTNRFFNMVVNAIAKSSDVNALLAYDLLQELKSMDACGPDIVSYTSVIECFSKSYDPNAAEMSLDLLQEVTDLYDMERRPENKPNHFTHSMVISALSKHPTMDNLLKAKELLDTNERMGKSTSGMTPRLHTYPYNLVLKCASKCGGTNHDRMKAFQVAAQVFKEMQQSKTVVPDSHTFAQWFDCCNNLLPESKLRTHALTTAFDRCKREGQLSPLALRRLISGSPTEVLNDLFHHTIDVHNFDHNKLLVQHLPEEWSQNVR